nr:hypothetical protein [uncultured Holophaga sp.]
MPRPTARTWISLALCLAAIGIMALYAFCSGECRYFKGTLFGVDLKPLGVLFMVVLGGLILLRKRLLAALALAAALGGEVLLVAFQIRQGRYCPFCLSYAAVVVILFGLNAQWRRYGLLLGALCAGALVFHFGFQGAFLPTYDLPIPIP